MSEPHPVGMALQAAVARLRATAPSLPEPEPVPPVTREARWVMRVWPRYVFATLDDVDDAVRERLTRWVRHVGESTTGSLVLTGEVGSGKTHTAVAVARALFLAGRTVECWATVDLLDALRPDGGVELDQLADVDVLVLDDLGAERPSEWVAERLYALVNRRWLYERPTIVTTNLVLGELATGLGARAASRLLHDALILHLQGKDRRQ